jgi:hypothetical protein
MKELKEFPVIETERLILPIGRERYSFYCGISSA